MPEFLIETDQLFKDYRVGTHVVHALRGVSVAIRPGDFVAVVGASGSGKSTFLNLLGCLDSPTLGRYRFDGDDVSGLPSDEQARLRNRRIGFVFQTFNLLPRLTALDNVALPLLYDRTLPRERRPRARAALESVGLADRLHHLPAQLSGGQQQRVGMARALVNEPVLLLADEPTGNLDSRTSVEIMSILQDLNRRRLTIVLITHERDIARFAHRILTFRDGRVVRDQPVDAPLDARAVLAALPEEAVAT
jgi:putative ABC transport system ATP-binding protein